MKGGLQKLLLSPSCCLVLLVSVHGWWELVNCETLGVGHTLVAVQLAGTLPL